MILTSQIGLLQPTRSGIQRPGLPDVESDISSTDFIDKMEGIGMMEINDEQRAEMAKAREAKKVKNAKKKFSSDAIRRLSFHHLYLAKCLV
jgi:hypothetical protein